MNWIKANLFNLINFALLLYVMYELSAIRQIAEQTNNEAELSNIKLDYVESDINQKQMVDSNDKNSRVKK